jgi:hypothetical protein
MILGMRRHLRRHRFQRPQPRRQAPADGESEDGAHHDHGPAHGQQHKGQAYEEHGADDARDRTEKDNAADRGG